MDEFFALKECYHLILDKLACLRKESDLFLESSLMNEIIFSLHDWKKIVQDFNSNYLLKSEDTEMIENIQKCFLNILNMDQFLMDGKIASAVCLLSTINKFNSSVSILLEDNLILLLHPCQFKIFQNNMNDYYAYITSPLSYISQICLFNACIGQIKDDLLIQNICPDGEKQSSFIMIVEKLLINLLVKLKSANEKLMMSRTLVLLTGKLKQLLKNLLCQKDSIINTNAIFQLFDYVDLHWEDPIDVIRYQTHVVFINIINIYILFSQSDKDKNKFLSLNLKKYLSLSWQTAYKYTTLSSLLEFMPGEKMLEICPELPTCVYENISAPSLAHNISSFLVKLWQGDIVDKKWCKIWLDPLLDSYLSDSHSRRQIINEHLIPQLYKHQPTSLNYIYQILQVNNDSQSTNHYSLLLQCVKHLKLNVSRLNQPANIDEIISKSLVHQNQLINREALTILCTLKKTTQIIPQSTLRQLAIFLKYNLHGQDSAGRQFVAYNFKHVFNCLNQSANFIIKKKKVPTATLR